MKNSLSIFNKIFYVLLIFIFYSPLIWADTTILEKKLTEQKQIYNNPISLLLFNPTYVMPYYYTASPYYAVYKNNTPSDQKIMPDEFKSQISFLIPLIPALFNDNNTSFNIAYTQLNYWQLYADSQYFRETNYEPEIFVQKYFPQHWLLRLGADHQSNGRGGLLERSWNRGYMSAQVSGEDWLISLKIWTLLFPAESSDIHNPDITHYLGYDSLIFSHKISTATASLELADLESGFRRGHIQLSLSYPLTKHLAFYLQYFNGYGQSLIEYNHRTQGAGIGIAFNNWI